MKIQHYAQLSQPQLIELLKRPALSAQDELRANVNNIINAVRNDGDVAVKRFTQLFDRVQVDNLRVSADEVAKACASIAKEHVQAIETAFANISRFHEAQKPKNISVETMPGVLCEKRYLPIRRVGLYVPAGSAPLVSTLMMLAIPATIAGCKTRVLCSPPNAQGEIDPHILYIAKLCNIQHIYKVGGAQAIAAMAYGTQSISKVDKIFGPGNSYVTCAKQLVALDCEGAALDMPAGPSEVMVIADRNASARFVASDLLSQAEHGADSHVVLVCDSEEFAQQVQIEIDHSLQTLTRASIVKQSLQHALALCVSDREQMIAIANEYAPEHLIIQTENPEQIAEKIECAGSVFIGAWSPESVGDYASGTNHVLPTYGYAKNYSGLSTLDFMNAISFQQLTQLGLQRLGPSVMTLATIEGLDAHRLAVAVRLEEK